MTTKALVRLDQTVCPRCGDDLVPMRWSEPALLRHGGYGATVTVHAVRCRDCGWRMERERSEIPPGSGPRPEVPPSPAVLATGLCARDRVLFALGYAGIGEFWNEQTIEIVADDILTILGIDRGASMEPKYMLRRTDGEDLFDEFAGAPVSSPSDWEQAEIDADRDDNDGPVEYEIITYFVAHSTPRTIGAES